jgi:hypothetical protein
VFTDALTSLHARRPIEEMLLHGDMQDNVRRHTALGTETTLFDPRSGQTAKVPSVRQRVLVVVLLSEKRFVEHDTALVVKDWDGQHPKQSPLMGRSVTAATLLQLSALLVSTQPPCTCNVLAATRMTSRRNARHRKII